MIKIGVLNLDFSILIKWLKKTWLQVVSPACNLMVPYDVFWNLGGEERTLKKMKDVVERIERLGREKLMGELFFFIIQNLSILRELKNYIERIF